MNPQTYGYLHCDVSLYSKCMQKMQRFARIPVSTEFTCRSALRKLEGECLDIGHCQNECEVDVRYPPRCGLFELISLQGRR